jgi:hemolysin activation/secretion protein
MIININKNTIVSTASFMKGLWVKLLLAFSVVCVSQTVLASTEINEVVKSEISLPELQNSNDDPTSFGTHLSKILVINDRINGPAIQPRTGLSGIHSLIDDQAGGQVNMSRYLGRFLNEPLSFRLINQIKAEIVRVYQVNNLPLVSVTVPPQEVSDGGLQINITPFIVGEVVVKGNKRYATSFISSQINLKPGELVSTNQLRQDLDWLAKNPFRNIQASFKSGTDYGTTDVILNVFEKEKLRTIAVGGSNSGTSATNKNRMFIGVSVGDLITNDDTVSYTGIIDPQNFLARQFIDINGRKGFLSHQFSYATPITLSGNRTRLKVEGQFLSTISQTGSSSFQSHSRTTVLNSELASPIDNWVGSLSFIPELYTRIEIKNANKVRLFNFKRVDATSAKSNLTQIPIGLRGSTTGTLFGAKTSGKLDASIVLGRGTDAGVTKPDFAYFGWTSHQNFKLTSELNLAVKSNGRYTRNALPSLAQSSIGGDSSVRGYEAGEISTEKGVVFNFEFRSKAVKSGLGEYAFNAVPYTFVDLGYASALGTRGSMNIASGGLGADITIGKSSIFKWSIARTFRPGVLTSNEAFGANINFVQRF